MTNDQLKDQLEATANRIVIRVGVTLVAVFSVATAIIGAVIALKT